MGSSFKQKCRTDSKDVRSVLLKESMYMPYSLIPDPIEELRKSITDTVNQQQ